jgi:hypothetical protein
MGFAEWDAAIAAGATLTELHQWDNGVVFSNRFKAKVVAWHRLSSLIGTHVEDARARKMEK